MVNKAIDEDRVPKVGVSVTSSDRWKKAAIS